MKQFVPNYYPRFACLMGACRHSCCVGWEIDIDPQSMDRYREQPAAARHWLEEGINADGETPCFRLSADERCAFLRPDGLCDMIIRLGKDSLCQVCADHPRFRNFFSDRVETGLGLCCEAAGQLILSQDAPAALVLQSETPQDEPPTEDEQYLLSLREQIIEHLQSRELPFQQRLREMLEENGLFLPEIAPQELAAHFLSLEQLDETWGKELQKLNAPVLHPAEALDGWETAWEQLAVYLLFRHLPGALEDGDLDGRILYTALIVQLIQALFLRQNDLTWDTLVNLCRLYSSEIEYSDENVAATLDWIASFFADQ